MDDPAGGPVGRILPELDFFSAGFPAFEISGGGEAWQQDVLLIEFSEEWDLAKARIWEYV